MSGHVSVPLYPGQGVSSAKYIMEHSEAKLLFVGEIIQAANIAQALPSSILSRPLKAVIKTANYFHSYLCRILPSGSPF